MNQDNYNRRNTMSSIISEYEAMSQRGTVVFYEETVFINLIKYYENENSINKAMTVVDQALNQHTYSTDLLVCKGRLLFEAKKLIEALKCLDKAHALAPNNVDIQVFRSEILSELGHHKEALRILEEINKTAKEVPHDFYWCKAVIQEKVFQFEEMFNSLKQYLIIHPNDVNALRKAWCCVAVIGNFEDSITFHQRLLDIDPYSYLAWHNLGQAYLNIKNYKKAVWAFEYSYITNPKFESGYKDYAGACIKMKQYNKALQAYEELLELENFTADSLTLLRIGECYEYKEDFGVAQAFYMKACIMNPNQDEVYFRTGECYAKCQKWECAIDAYKKAIELDDNKSPYYASLGESYYQIGEDVKAKNNLQTAADKAPDDPTYWIQYASFLMDIDSIPLAIETLEEAAMYTSGVELEYCMAACKLRIGEKEAAIGLLTRALNKTYDKHDIFFNLVPDLSNEVEILDLIKFYSQN